MLQGAGTEQARTRFIKASSGAAAHLCQSSSHDHERQRVRLASRCSEWGLKRVYGYPGDGVGGLDVALEKAKDTMQYVQVRHEEMAAFMASAHAKFTGEVGLCYATSGPGAIHLLNGLYDAKMDHVPVVAIVGQQARTAIGAHYQQEVDLQSLFKDVAGDYVAMASVPGRCAT